MLANGFEIFLLADGLGRHGRLAIVSLDAVGDESFERGSAFMFHHVQSMSEFPVAHGGAALKQAFQ